LKPLFGWVGEGVTLQAHNGEWWIGTGNGLYRFRAAAELPVLAHPLKVYTTSDGLAAPQVYRLFEDSRGDIWVSSTSTVNGLARWNHATQTIQDLSGTTGLPSLKENLPRDFAEDHAGDIWVGFSSGVARFRQGSFSVFAAEQGSQDQSQFQEMA